MPATLTPASAPLARQARERFVAHMEGVLPELAQALRNALVEQMNSAQSSRDMQQRRDALVEYEQASGKWVDGAARAWRRAVVPATATTRASMELKSLELIGDDVVENKILSSRLAMAIQEKAVWDLNDLKLRITHLEGGEELATEDVLRPEAMSQILVEQWTAADLTRATWVALKDVLQQHIVPRAVAGYKQANEFLVRSGVLPHIDLRSSVKRPAAPGRGAAPAPAPGEPAANGADAASADGVGGPGARRAGEGTREPGRAAEPRARLVRLVRLRGPARDIRARRVRPPGPGRVSRALPAASTVRPVPRIRRVQPAPAVPADGRVPRVPRVRRVRVASRRPAAESMGPARPAGAALSPAIPSSRRAPPASSPGRPAPRRWRARGPAPPACWASSSGCCASAWRATTPPRSARRNPPRRWCRR